MDVDAYPRDVPKWTPSFIAPAVAGIDVFRSINVLRQGQFLQEIVWFRDRRDKETLRFIQGPIIFLDCIPMTEDEVWSVFAHIGAVLTYFWIIQCWFFLLLHHHTPTDNMTQLACQ